VCGASYEQHGAERGCSAFGKLACNQFPVFDTFKDSPNYRHTVQLRNQEQMVYFDRQTVTLVEVNKFLGQPEKFANDNCRIALWLRAIEALNCEADFSRFERDPMFKILQNEVKRVTLLQDICQIHG